MSRDHGTPARSRVGGGRFRRAGADVRRPRPPERASARSRRTPTPPGAALRSASGRATRTPRARGRNPAIPRLQTSRRCSTARRIGVSGFLISCAMIRAISAHAARRLDRTTSDTSSMHGHPRALAAERQRHRHDAPSLAGPGLDLDGLDGRVRDREDPRGARRIASPGKTSSSVAASARPPPSAAAAGSPAGRARPREARRRRRSGGRAASRSAPSPPAAPRSATSRLRDIERKARTSSFNSSSGGSAMRGEKSPRATARVPSTRSATGRATRSASRPGHERGEEKTRRLNAETAPPSAARPRPPPRAAAAGGGARAVPGLRTPGTPGTARERRRDLLEGSRRRRRREPTALAAARRGRSST